MSEAKFFVGLDLTGFEDNGEHKPISRVTFLRDDENAVTAGDDTGMEIVADCPHATQAMADAALAKLKGIRYHAYSAEDANIDPAAELGDGVTASRVYSVISRLDDDGSGYAGVSAPGDKELEDEYPAEGPVTQNFNRKVTGLYSYINKTATQIALGVVDEINQTKAELTIEIGKIDQRLTDDINGLESSFTLSMDGINQKVNGIDGTVATLSNTVDGFSAVYATKTGVTNEIKSSIDGISLSVSNGSESSTLTLKNGSATLASAKIQFTGDIVFASNLTDGTTRISGNNIKTGYIDADRLNLYGPMEVYEDDGGNLGGYIGYIEGEAYNDNGSVRRTEGIGVKAPSAAGYEGGAVFCTDSGARLTYGEDMFGDTSTIACVGQHCYSSRTMETFSDRRLKNSIQYDLLERYEAFYRSLKPCRFKMNSERNRNFHVGFVAQEVKQALEDNDIPADELEALTQFRSQDGEEGMYAIGYSEFVAMNTAMIQKLLKRVDELEKEIETLKGMVNNG